MRRRTSNRRGAGLAEFAIVAPVLFMLLMGTVIGSMGIFQSQQVARMAREGSRWASVHGAGYAAYTGNALPTEANVYTYGMLPYAGSLSTTNAYIIGSPPNSPGPLSYSVTWVDSTHTSNTVTVTVKYQWSSVMYFGSPTFSSSSTAIMSN
jgi:Flp pilus assembly protein TadG